MNYSRREFISKVGIGSTLLTSLPAASALSNAFSLPEDKKLGIALVGLGGYATNQLAVGLQQTKNCYLAGIVTGTPEKAEKWKKQYNIPDQNIYNYENFDKIVDNKAIDVVYVVLPNSMHKEFTIRAAKAGKHVICEKPMALSSADCQEMIDVCKKAGVRLFIGYRLHTEPFNKAAAQFRTQSGVGAVKVVEAEMGFRIGDPAQWRLKKALAGGGAMMDVGIYAIQGARYSTGEEPTYVIAQEFKTDPVKFKEVDETISWQMEFPSGAVCNLTTTYATSVDRLFIGAENGWFELRPAFNYGPLKGRTNKGELDLPIVHHQATQMDEFVRCIIEKCESNADGAEGMRDMKVIEAIYRSLQSGKREKV